MLTVLNWVFAVVWFLLPLLGMINKIDRGDVDRGDFVVVMLAWATAGVLATNAV